MAKILIQTRFRPQAGRIAHCLDGIARRRCRVCGCTIYGRNSGICRNCLAQYLPIRKEVLRHA